MAPLAHLPRTISLALVEDNPDHAELTVEVLREHGVDCEIKVLRDGQEALAELLAGNGPLPDLVLLDLKLPKVSGLDVLRELRAHRRTRLVPIAILTSSLEESDLVSAYANGANCYVRKPVGFDEFHEAIGAIASFWLRVNQSPPVSAEVEGDV